MSSSSEAAVARVLSEDTRIAYGLVFGSTGRGQAHRSSDLDLAIGLTTDVALTPLAMGRLVSDLERASGRTVDLVLLDEASPALAYRVFRDGIPVFVRDRPAMIERQVKAVIDYLDYRPFETAFVRGVMSARG